VYEAEEVFDAVFPSSDESAIVLHPGENPFDLPSAPVSAQRPAILGLPFAIGSVGRDHLNAIFLGQRLIECVRVVGLVADQSFGQLVEEAPGQNRLDKPALSRRSAFDSDGERKTVTRSDSDDLGALAALGGADREAPFLALAKVASTNASCRWSLPRSCRCLASKLKASTNLPARTHCWKRR
jgi:hypothetical protein